MSADRRIAIVACGLLWSGLVVAAGGEVGILVSEVLHFDELCDSDGARARLEDCGEPQRLERCDALARLTSAPGEGAVEPRAVLDALVRRYAAVVVHAEVCADAESDRDDRAEAIAQRIDVTVTALPGAFAELRDSRAARLHSAMSEARHSMQFARLLARSDEATEVTVDGERVSATELLDAYCASVGEDAARLLDRFEEYERALGAVPAASFDVDSFAASAYDALADLLDAIGGSKECGMEALEVHGWRVAGRAVTPEGRSEPPQAPNRPAPPARGKDPRSVWREVASATEAVRSTCVEGCAAADAEAPCRDLKQRAVRLAEEYEAKARLSANSSYHFLEERALQLEMTRELYRAGLTLEQVCGVDTHASRHRGLFLRYVAEVGRLADPALGRSLLQLLARHYDLDPDAPL
ncbi:MAG: hypothetical protein GY716_21105 [bacterium]|nr:hypothetical protein [bacterium]